MIGTKLHWVDVPWPGRLALAARPRGGDWLEDEIQNWRREGIATVFSLLTPEEEADLGIAEESATVQAAGMRFLSLPIADRQVPDSEPRFAEALLDLEVELRAGRNVVLHCRQGMDAGEAVRRLSAARGVPVPETAEQRQWIDRYARTSMAAHHG